VPVVWVQEEPINSGSWPFLRFQFGETIAGGRSFQVNGRPISASPATGSGTSHKIEQQTLLQNAFELT